MELQVLSRHPGRPWLWSIRRLELAAEQPDLVKAWVRSTRQQLRGLSYRCVSWVGGAGAVLHEGCLLRQRPTQPTAVAVGCSALGPPMHIVSLTVWINKAGAGGGCGAAGLSGCWCLSTHMAASARPAAPGPSWLSPS